MLLAVMAASCVTLTPEGQKVAVFTAPVDAPPERHQMPDGCERLTTLPRDWMSEQEIEGQTDPFTKQRNASAVAGGNAVLVLRKLARPRRDPDCPNASPIRDCPGVSGAWYNVDFEAYRCSAEALRALTAVKGPAR